MAAYGKVCVAGAGNGVGRECVDVLLADGVKVKALVRREDAKAELEALGCEVVLGDASDDKLTQSAIDGCDAVITTLGGKSEEGSRIDYIGNNNVIENCGILGVPRVVLVTSVGCGDSKDALPDEVYASLEEALVEKTKAENLLLTFYKMLQWTIVRPGGLRSEEATGTGVLTTDTSAVGSITRKDVAALVVKALNSKSAVKKVLTALDPKEDQTVEAFEF